MTIVLSSIVSVLVFEWRDALDAILKGKLALDKVKVHILNAYFKTYILYLYYLLR